MSISRKDFIKNISIVTIGLTSFSKLLSSSTLLNFDSLNIIKDPKGVLSLPKGFSYSVLSKLNDKMDDGLNVPDKADGMGCFKLD